MANVQIIVKVERRSINPSQSLIKCFERIIEYSADVVFPYSTVITALKVLYGSNSVISFSNEDI